MQRHFHQGGSVTIELLAPAGDSVAVGELLKLPEVEGEPFAAARRATLARLSNLVLRDPVLRADAASVALAYWLRRANIDRLTEGYERRLALDPEIVFVPVGRVFHVAPGNVDTVFVYSWAIAWLCGNQSIVRVAGRRSDVLRALLGLVDRTMRDDPELAAGNRFITYEHSDEVSAALSRWSNHRVLWGGDETVTHLRAMPLSPHSSERAFGSKYSWSVVKAASYLGATGETVTKLAAGFFNDIFWFDQMACSSPHMLVWIGSAADTSKAIDRFHTALAGEVARRGYRGADSSAMNRLNFAFDLACEADLTADLSQQEFLGIRLADAEAPRQEICGGGLFTHVRAESLTAAAALARENGQTVTQFGFAREELVAFAKLAGARGIDRLVPVGEALAFDVNWDGFDLIGDFLRRVTVRPQA